jgi:hypothetical protein
MIRCTCCQAEITCPQFFNGKPYGYTCVKKVSGQKRVKREYVACESFKVIQGEGTQRQVIRLTLNGVRKDVVCYVDLQDGRWSVGYVQDGILYVPK